MLTPTPPGITFAAVIDGQIMEVTITPEYDADPSSTARVLHALMGTMQALEHGTWKIVPRSSSDSLPPTSTPSR